MIYILKHSNGSYYQRWLFNRAITTIKKEDAKVFLEKETAQNNATGLGSGWEVITHKVKSTK